MTATPEHYDDLETRDPEERRRRLFERLPQQIAHAQKRAPGMAAILAGIDPSEVTSAAALARIPVTRKSDLVRLQTPAAPLAGLTALPPGACAHLFATPGPIYAIEARRPDFWRLARALFAAGFRTGDVIHNAFSYHLSPGGWMLDGGARALGCAVIPGGVGNTEQQALAVAHFRPAGYTGTPDFLKVLLDKGAELGLDMTSLAKALVSGAALPESLRREFQARGVPARQCYVTADLGLIAYESSAGDGMIVDEDVIVEIVRPGTGDPLPEGEVGEVVVTALNPDYPLIRFATGDLSAVLAGVSACGRTNTRIKGWMGRADQTAKVKGMFVHPAQVAEVARRHPEIAKARLVVEREGDADAMTLKCEVTGGGEALAHVIAGTLGSVCKVRGRVAFVAAGELPNDGKVIDDVRRYD